MVDIEYIKQIDEVLDMPEWRVYPERDGGLNYIPDGEENSVYAIYIKDGVMTGGLAIYKLYLQEVIEAINKKYNSDDNYFNYRIIQKDDLIEVLFIDEHCESYSGLTDESKESAIIYIMDHIKEKV